MPDTNLTVALARIAGLPFRFRSKRPLTPPKKAVMLKTCCISQVMLATPLLTALGEAFPEAVFDWALAEWARPAVAGHPRVRQLIDTGPVGLGSRDRAEIRALIERLRQGGYDTCFIPSRSAALSYVAWQAGIPQRIGLDKGGRGFAHTIRIAVKGREEQHEADLYLGLAAPFGIDARPEMAFYPTDGQRTSATRRLVEEIGWQGEEPLVVLHPGGGENPVRPELGRRWPAARFSLLGSRLAREHKARVIVVGAQSDRRLAEDVYGMMHIDAPNLAGQINLGEMGALCEVADLYVGNDAGPTYVAAGVRCPTLAIFGPTDPARIGPYGRQDRVVCLGGTIDDGPFSWEQGITVEEAMAAADRLLAR